MTRAQAKRWTLAYNMARQIADGTLPDEGVIVCPDNESAQLLLADIKVCVEMLSRSSRS